MAEKLVPRSMPTSLPAPLAIDEYRGEVIDRCAYTSHREIVTRAGNARKGGVRLAVSRSPLRARNKRVIRPSPPIGWPNRHYPAIGTVDRATNQDQVLFVIDLHDVQIEYCDSFRPVSASHANTLFRPAAAT